VPPRAMLVVVIVAIGKICRLKCALFAQNEIFIYLFTYVYLFIYFIYLYLYVLIYFIYVYLLFLILQKILCIQVVSDKTPTNQL